MTLDAFEANVPASERKAGFVVVKVLCHLRHGKALRRVTSAAIDTKLTFVDVVVTGFAVCEIDSLIDRTLQWTHGIRNQRSGTLRR